MVFDNNLTGITLSRSHTVTVTPYPQIYTPQYVTDFLHEVYEGPAPADAESPFSEAILGLHLGVSFEIWRTIRRSGEVSVLRKDPSERGRSGHFPALL